MVVVVRKEEAAGRAGEGLACDVCRGVSPSFFTKVNNAEVAVVSKYCLDVKCSEAHYLP